jgi:5-methylcytosine-specific restriction enzyme A
MKNPIVQLKKAWSLRGERRSPQWPGVRKTHLILEPWCRQCGRTDGLEVHHISPFHLHPELELDPKNLITLCENIGKQCHLKCGHFGNWKDINPDIEQTADCPRPSGLMSHHQ